MAGLPGFGGSEPLRIFQDDFFNHPDPSAAHAPAPAPMKPQRQPLQSADPNLASHHAGLKPPHNPASRPANPPLTPLKPARAKKLKMVPMMPPTSQPPSTDSLEKKPPLMSRFKTVAQKPAPAPPALAAAAPVKPRPKTHKAICPAPPTLNISMEQFCPKPSSAGVPALLDPAPITELRPAKKNQSDGGAPPPGSTDSFPPIIDDGSKPAHSYAQLIGMAILRSPQRRLTLAQIYKWISDTFSFYGAQDAGWQNSIRHNLSLNKHFIKQERPKDDPGKGNYWAIEPGKEDLFAKEKPSRKSSSANESLSSVSSSRLEPFPPPLPVVQESLLGPAPTLGPTSSSMCQSSLPPLSSQGPAPQPPSEPSSDATIPVSDAPGQDEGSGGPAGADLNNDFGLYSPLPAAMHSSPPIPRRIEPHPGGTPPPPPRMRRNQGSSATKPRSRKRKITSMDDSGYISSLESSAMRPQHHGGMPTSEVDRPRIKRGRAEEEIARLRSSSYDSPSTGRSWNGYVPTSSSPLRQLANDSGGQMLPPLTPAMKLKAPPKPPPSVSPGTNLRLHRENVRSMIESPYRRVASMLPKGETVLQLTPGFNIDEVFYGIDRKTDDFAPDGGDFDIFQDGPFAPMFALSPLAAAANGSPVKRSVKKPRMDRSQSVSALHDVTNSAPRSSFDPSSFLRVPSQALNMASDTPSKVFDCLPPSPGKAFALQSPSKMPPATSDVENIAPWISFDDFCSANDSLGDGDFSGIDMLAGFEKIGSHHAQSQPQQPLGQPKNSQKPGLGRSYSTNF